MCGSLQPQGPELGPSPVAAPHPGPTVPGLAGQGAHGAGPAESTTDLCPTDQQAGGTLEGGCGTTRDMYWCWYRLLILKPSVPKLRYVRQRKKQGLNKCTG